MYVNGYSLYTLMSSSKEIKFFFTLALYKIVAIKMEACTSKPADEYSSRRTDQLPVILQQ